MKWCPKKETNCQECAYGCMNIAHDEGRKPIDGNDMVAAMNKMVITYSDNENYNDWDSFSFFAFQQEGYEIYDKEILKEFIPTLMQPARFFDLLEQWLENR
jgi:hypothetical protein